jgi:hypothetical protein
MILIKTTPVKIINDLTHVKREWRCGDGLHQPPHPHFTHNLNTSAGGES